MNKGDIIDLVAADMEITKTEAGRAVDAVIQAIAKGVSLDGKVTIAGFGAFQAKDRAARTGINPTTKQPIQIAATRTCAFKPAPALREQLLEPKNGSVMQAAASA
ncbi:MAG: HU family DNA-binding protein [Planctomycetota bacterium]